MGLREHELTPAAAEAVCLAGLLGSFADAAADIRTRLAGLRLAESTGERAPEAAGGRLAQALAQGQTFGAAQDWAWHQDAEGQTVASVLADSTGVPQQGEGGATAAAKMANVLALANPVPEDRARWAYPSRVQPPPWQARYLAAVPPWAELGRRWRRQGGPVGRNRAQRWVALCDGANGLADFLTKNFPRVDAVILDFWHAAAYLGKLSKALHPQDEQAAEAWRGPWCHRLKHEGGQAVLAALRDLAVRGRAARAWLQEVVTSFTNPVQRMDYPRYRAKGGCLGSGVVESACQRVVGQRLKGAGLRWGEDGADAVCPRRALYLSDPGQWDAFGHPN